MLPRNLHIYQLCATSWGCEHNRDGIDSFLSMEHHDVDCLQSVSPKYPFVSASPDGCIIVPAMESH